MRARFPAVAAPTCNERLPSTAVFLESQLDTSMASPGVTGISNGVVKPDTDVEDGTEISTVSLVVAVASCVTFLRNI